MGHRIRGLMSGTDLPNVRERQLQRSEVGMSLEHGQMLRDLLAVIHRDGGEHTALKGIRQSVLDAHQVWAKLRIAAELNKPKPKMKSLEGRYASTRAVGLEPVTEARIPKDPIGDVYSGGRDNDDWHYNHG